MTIHSDYRSTSEDKRNVSICVSADLQTLSIITIRFFHNLILLWAAEHIRVSLAYDRTQSTHSLCRSE